MGWTPRTPPARVHMADLELLHFDHHHQPDHRESSCSSSSPGREKQRGGGGGAGSAPWTETSFSCRLQDDDEEEEDDVQLIETSPQTCRPIRTSSTGLHEEEEEEQEEEEEEEEEDIPELYLLSDEDLSSEASGKSVDYGFIIAVSCLVTGISLVTVSYAVPRDVRVPDRDSVSAREMERLERDKARVGAHLDRCVIAGLCLLTLGGVLLSTLLMVSMWKGEMMRRKALAFSKHAANLYGSMSLRTGSSSHLEEEVEALS